jgi:hypothetical protein
MLDATNTSCRDGGGADLTAFLGSGPFFSDVAAAPSAPRLDCELGTHDLSFPEPEVASGPFVPDYPARGGDCDPEDDGWTEISNHDATKSARHFDIRSLTYQQANGAHPCNNYHFECGEEESDVNELLLDAIDSPTPEAVSSLLRKLKKERVFVNDERDAVQVLNCSGNVVAQFPREMAAGLSFATK